LISVIDTNILLDIFLPDPNYGESSLILLERAYQQGSLSICDIVYSELAPQFKNKELLDDSLEKIGVTVTPPNTNTLFKAGHLWLQYRKKSNLRDRIIPDFIIGAFAMEQGDRLLTRDRGFYRDYFLGLKINL